MPDVQVLLAAVLGMLIATTGVVIGWVAGRQSVKPVTPALRGYDPNGVGEETVEVRTAAPESVEVDADLSTDVPEDFGTGYWPVTQRLRLNPLEDETVRVRVPGARVEGESVTEAPWAYLTRNRRPEDWLKLTRTQEQRKLDGVSG